MKKKLTRKWYALMGILSLTGIAGAAPPANNGFPNAINLGGAATVNTTGDNTEATLGSGEPDGPFESRTGSIWYRWTAPASGWVEMDTANSGFDTVLAVGTGATLAAYSEIVFNDEDPEGDYGSGMFFGESRLFFQAQAGAEYRIAVCGYFGGEGPVQLHIAPSAAPPARISSATALPGSANVTNSEVDITFTIAAQSAQGIGSIQVIVYLPDGNFVSSLYLGDFEMTGTPQNGTWSGVLTMPRYLPPGDYPVSYSISDDQGELLGAYGRDYNGYLPIPGTMISVLPVTNAGIVDTDAPEITAFSASPPSVDVASAPAMVTCTFTAVDDLTGVSGIDVSILDAFGFYLAGGYAYPDMDFGGLIGGNANAGTYSVMIEVPQGTASGMYYFETYSTDRVGNSYTQGSVPGGGFADGPLPGNPSFVVTNSGFVGTPFDQWASGNGLVPPLNGETDIPFKDRVENLLKYAFNMEGSGPDHHVLVPGSGASGLPAVYRSAGGVTVEYVARSGANADSRLSYSVETSIDGEEFDPAGIAGTPTPINALWNRVRVVIPFPPGGTILARLSVGYAP